MSLASSARRRMWMRGCHWAWAARLWILGKRRVLAVRREGVMGVVVGVEVILLDGLFGSFFFMVEEIMGM